MDVVITNNFDYHLFLKTFICLLISINIFGLTIISLNFIYKIFNWNNHSILNIILLKSQYKSNNIIELISISFIGIVYLINVAIIILYLLICIGSYFKIVYNWIYNLI